MESRSVARVGRRLGRYTWEGTFWSDSNFHTWIETVITQMCSTYVSKAKEQNSLNGGILGNANPTSKKLILNGKKKLRTLVSMHIHFYLQGIFMHSILIISPL